MSRLSPSQLIPNGLRIPVLIVTAAPPFVGIRFSSPADQNTSDSPSGENTGLVIGPPGSAEPLPRSGVASICDIDFRNSWPLATNAVRVPSGEIVRTDRPALVNL